MIEKLKHRITLQRLVSMVNSNGFEEQSWVDVASVWAGASNLHGREFFAAAAVQRENTIKFLIRYFPSVDQSMRIFFRGKQYDIIAIDNIKHENRYMEIQTEEVIDRGRGGDRRNG